MSGFGGAPAKERPDARGVCLHGVWRYGKSLTAVRCLDYRRCEVCGATEYKQQWEGWQ